MGSHGAKSREPREEERNPGVPPQIAIFQW